MRTSADLTQIDVLADSIRELARRGGGIEEALPIVIHTVGLTIEGVLAGLASCRTHLEVNIDDVGSRRAVSIMESISRLPVFVHG
ncbi:MAG: hypothetical protein NVS3B21_30260 [Acidimicrobiales bacterium]